MKIIFTTKGDNWESLMDPRFGRTNLLLIFNEDTNALTSISNSASELMEHGAGLQAVKKVLDLKPDVIITGNGAGEKALQLLKKSSVKMYTGAGEMSVREAYNAYKNDKLQLQF